MKVTITIEHGRTDVMLDLGDGEGAMHIAAPTGAGDPATPNGLTPATLPRGGPITDSLKRLVASQPGMGWTTAEDLVRAVRPHGWPGLSRPLEPVKAMERALGRGVARGEWKELRDRENGRHVYRPTAHGPRP